MLNDLNIKYETDLDKMDLHDKELQISEDYVEEQIKLTRENLLENLKDQINKKLTAHEVRQKVLKNPTNRYEVEALDKWVDLMII